MTDDRVFRIHVRATPEAAWQALTDPDTVRQYYFGTAPRSTWRPGAVIDFVDDDGVVQMTGEILTCDPPRTLAHTFIPTWGGERDDQGSLTWTIEAEASGCRITLVHAGGHGSETLEGSQQLIDALAELLGPA